MPGYASKLATVGALALIASALASTSSRADTVTFSTTGTFTAPAGSGAQAQGNLLGFSNSQTTAALSYESNSGDVFADDTTQPTVTLGNFNLLVFGSSALDVPSSPSSPTFTMTLSQSSPTAGTTNLTADITGRLNYSSNNGVSIDFSQTSLVIGNITYELILPSSNSLMLSPNLNGTSSTSVALTATILANTASVPEPTSMVLLGIGLAGVGGYRLRRRRQAA